MPVLIDTGALELLRRGDPRVEVLAFRNYPPVLCPHVTGEYIHCQLRARVSQGAMLKARTYVAAFETLHPAAGTADRYAELRATLLDQGVTLPEPYYWIAAHALEHGIPLVTTDRTFRQLPGLKVHLVQLLKRVTVSGLEAGGRIIRKLKARPLVADRGADPRPGRTIRGGPQGGPVSALALFTLYFAQDCLAESAALLQCLGEAACGFC